MDFGSPEKLSGVIYFFKKRRRKKKRCKSSKRRNKNNKLKAVRKAIGWRWGGRDGLKGSAAPADPFVWPLRSGAGAAELRAGTGGEARSRGGPFPGTPSAWKKKTRAGKHQPQILPLGENNYKSDKINVRNAVETSSWGGEAKQKKFPVLSQHRAPLSSPPEDGAVAARASSCPPGRGSLPCINQPGPSAGLGPVARN